MTTKFDLEWWAAAERRALRYGAEGKRQEFNWWIQDASLGAQDPAGIRETLTAWFETGKEKGTQ